ncbi:MAG TPA: ferritin family protein, partial [Afifellaceae bacterium]|nr:ferritin family protein [Afifellaceae bacterium]
VRREHVAGFYARRPYWLVRTLGLERVRREAMLMEAEARNFYRRAAERTSDAQTRKLLGDLVAAEAGHMRSAERFERQHLGEEAREEEQTAERRLFLLQIVQPGLAGLMDGSVSTLAPLFAAAFATQSTWETFLVGMAASVGAGISMGFAEALSDDGALTGRGSPLVRGLASGLMTTLGGVGHALPYLIPDFFIATTLAIVVVLFELWAIAWVRWKYMDTPFWRAAFQIVLGGSLVFAAGILIGNA